MPLCPSETALSHFVAGLGPDAESAELEAHLAVCSSCLARLQRVHAQDRLTAAVGAQRTGFFSADEPAIKRLLDRLTAEGPEAAEAPTAVPAVGDTPSSDGPHLSAPLPERIGPYRIVGVLGSGGMGVVYEAEDPALKRHVAIKAMKPAGSAAGAARERFLREARAAASVHHDHIVPIYHVGEEGGTPYLVMPLLRGETLQTRLRRERFLAPSEVARLGAEIACGLGAAHSHGLVHRDVKPANVWLELGVAGPPRVRLLDFGLACARAGEPRLTERGMVVGTPAFMAPEQAAGAEADPRCDLFSLGCVLYEAATGRPPFRGRDTLATLVAAATDQPVAPSTVNPAVTPALSRLILQLLEKEPSSRPRSAQTVAEALRRLQDVPAQLPGRRQFSKWIVTALALVLGAAGFLFAPAVVRIIRGEGVLTIWTQDRDVRVLLKPEEGDVTLIDTHNGKEVKLRAGRYALELATGQDGFSLSTDHFTLRRGAREIVEVEWRSLQTSSDQKSVQPDEQPVAPRAADNPSLHEFVQANAVEIGTAPAPRPVFSQDGGFLATGGDRTVRIWDTKTGHMIAGLNDHSDQVTCAAISADGQLLVSAGGEVTVEGRRRDGSDFDLRLWDLAGKRLLHRLTGHTGPVWGVAVSTDKRFALSGGKDATLRLWDLTTGKQVHAFAENDTRVWCAVFAPDGQLALSGGRKHAVYLWDVASRRLRGVLEGHTGPIMSVAFSSDGRRAVSASLDGSARIWDIETARSIAVLAGHDAGLVQAVFSPDGSRVLTASGAREKPDGGFLSANHGFGLTLWDAAEHRKLGELREPRMPRGIAFTKGGAIYSVTDDGIVKALSCRPRRPK